MTPEELQTAIEQLEALTTTNNQQRLINYLRSNYEDILEAFS